ncbi:MAG: hypothetical protein HYY49_14020 [Ignavibacteriales bacterium]|nr:hypothetical protein [Ignavibacteriales bacterium]
MRSAFSWAAAILLIAGTANGQLKSRPEERPSVSESIIRSDNSGLMFGWFDPSRLTMHHSYSLSYSSFGGQGLSLGVYTNSLLYQFSDPLSVQFDISLMHSPYNTFGNEFGKNFSGVYLSRAQLNYKPTDNMWLQIQFRQVPSLYWLGNSGYYLPNYYNGFDVREENNH